MSLPRAVVICIREVIFMELHYVFVEFPQAYGNHSIRLSINMMFALQKRKVNKTDIFKENVCALFEPLKQLEEGAEGSEPENWPER